MTAVTINLGAMAEPDQTNTAEGQAQSNQAQGTAEEILRRAKHGLAMSSKNGFKIAEHNPAMIIM